MCECDACLQFVGSSAAAQHLAASEEFRRARVIKVHPSLNANAFRECWYASISAVYRVPPEASARRMRARTHARVLVCVVARASCAFCVCPLFSRRMELTTLAARFSLSRARYLAAMQRARLSWFPHSLATITSISASKAQRSLPGSVRLHPPKKGFGSLEGPSCLC